MTYQQKPPQRKPITRTFNPPLAFKLMTTAQHKRWWAKWMAHRNYRERLGHPLKMVAPEPFNLEVQALESRIIELETDRISDDVGRIQAAMRNVNALLLAIKMGASGEVSGLPEKRCEIQT